MQTLGAKDKFIKINHTPERTVPKADNFVIKNLALEGKTTVRAVERIVPIAKNM